MKTTTVRINEDDKKLLEVIKSKTHKPQNWIIHEALTEYYKTLLDSYKNKKDVK